MLSSLPAFECSVSLLLSLPSLLPLPCLPTQKRRKWNLEFGPYPFLSQKKLHGSIFKVIFQQRKGYKEDVANSWIGMHENFVNFNMTQSRVGVEMMKIEKNTLGIICPKSSLSTNILLFHSSWSNLSDVNTSHGWHLQEFKMMSIGQELFIITYSLIVLSHT